MVLPPNCSASLCVFMKQPRDSQSVLLLGPPNPSCPPILVVFAFSFCHQKLYVRSSIIGEVGSRVGADGNTASGRVGVCDAFKDLIRAMSWSSFVVRSPSFTPDGLKVLRKCEKDQVSSSQRHKSSDLGRFSDGKCVARGGRDCAKSAPGCEFIKAGQVRTYHPRVLINSRCLPQLSTHVGPSRMFALALDYATDKYPRSSRRHG